MDQPLFRPRPDLFAAIRSAQVAAMDEIRGAQARTLDLFGFGTRECAHDVVATGVHWQLRRYRAASGGTPLLLVPAPIKRPYIWDLTPEVSVVRFCLERGLSVHLVEWRPPAETDGPAGIEEYARAIAGAVAAMTPEGAAPAPAPFMIGHSLGGTLAAIACALQPGLARGLVLLGAPLSFEPGSSLFRDLVVAQHHGLPEDDIVPGWQLSQRCAAMSPGSFVLARWMDAALSLTDPAALALHLHVERWALDEVALPGRLIRQMVDWLYREDRFRLGGLTLGGQTLGPGALRLPVLALVNPADEIGPRAAVEPFFARMQAADTGADTRVIEHEPEIGVGLQHLAILAGRRAHAEIWPQIADWIAARR